MNLHENSLIKVQIQSTLQSLNIMLREVNVK